MGWRWHYNIQSIGDGLLPLEGGIAISCTECLQLGAHHSGCIVDYFRFYHGKTVGAGFI